MQNQYDESNKIFWDIERPWIYGEINNPYDLESQYQDISSLQNDTYIQGYPSENFMKNFMEHYKLVLKYMWKGKEQRTTQDNFEGEIILTCSLRCHLVIKL